MISLYGGSGFVGGNFKRMYDSCLEMQRDERKPKTKDILYFISTVDNYNVHDRITLDVDTNLHILCEVLDHCRSKDITFNFISSWFVYGKTPYMPAQEDSVCNPTGFYSITKFCAEKLIQSFAETYGMKYRILRLCNVLGSGDQKASRKKNALTWMVDQLKINHDIQLYNHGSHTRDVMHVQDVCRAIKLVIDNGNLNEIYNIGSGKPTTVGEIIYTAQHYLKSKSKIENIDPPMFHKSVQTENFWMDTTKLRDLGFEPKLSLEFIVKDLCL
jgi:nucleoside-diphosphate-sugar epimerase